MPVIEEIEKELENSKLDNETKKYFEELSNFVDWFAVNEKMNEQFQTILLLILDKLEYLAELKIL